MLNRQWRVRTAFRRLTIHVDPVGASKAGKPPANGAFLWELLTELARGDLTVTRVLAEVHHALHGVGSRGDTLRRLATEPRFRDQFAEDLERSLFAGKLSFREIAEGRVLSRTIQTAPATPSAQEIVDEFATFIAIELVDQEGLAVSNRLVRLELPDGEIREERTNSNGQIRITGIGKAGSAKLSFLDLASVAAG